MILYCWSLKRLYGQILNEKAIFVSHAGITPPSAKRAHQTTKLLVLLVCGAVHGPEPTAAFQRGYARTYATAVAGEATSMYDPLL